MAAARLLQAGQMSHAQIASQMGVSQPTLRRWAHQLTTGGQDALRRRVCSGRKPRLNSGQWQQILATLHKGAQAAGFPTQRWTLARIQRVILEAFGVRYNVNYLSERLHHLGWSVQEPAVTAVNAAIDWSKPGARAIGLE